MGLILTFLTASMVVSLAGLAVCCRFQPMQERQLGAALLLNALAIPGFLALIYYAAVASKASIEGGHGLHVFFLAIAVVIWVIGAYFTTIFSHGWISELIEKHCRSKVDP